MSQDNFLLEQFKVQREANVEEDILPSQNLILSPYASQYNNLMSPFDKLINKELILKKLKAADIHKEKQSAQKQITILKIKASKYYQIVQLKVKVGFYKFKINIINLEGESPIHAQEPFGLGSFGKLYKFKGEDGKMWAVKCLQIKNPHNFEEELLSVILEYSYLKIASALESAPCLHSNTFDLFVYREANKSPEKETQCKDCIQFVMEYCEKVKKLENQDFQSLFSSLYTLHLIGLVHNDIKSPNIHYSPIFQKWIFLDYGVSLFLQNPQGTETFTSFRGTLKYSGPQMQRLYPNKQAMVDLYWNDVKGLQFSLDQLARIKYYAHNEGSSEGKRLKDPRKIQTHFLLTQLKFNLYFNNFNKIDLLSKIIKGEQQSEISILRFLAQLHYLNPEVKDIFQKTINLEHIPSEEGMDPFSIFGLVTSSIDFRNSHCSLPDMLQKKNLFQDIYNQLLLGTSHEHNELLLKVQMKKKRKKIIAILENPKQCKSLNKQTYLQLLFSTINFFKSKFPISLSQKIKICQIFQDSTSNEHTQNDNPKQTDLNELKPLIFFFNSIIEACLSTNSQLKKLLVQVFINYVMLGLGCTKTIESVYKAISTLSQIKEKVCTSFYLIHQNRFWYQKIIKLNHNIDVLSLRKCALDVMEEIAHKFNLIPQRKHICPQKLCIQKQKELVKSIYNQSAFAGKDYYLLANKLKRCEQIITTLKNNLALKEIQVVKKEQKEEQLIYRTDNANNKEEDEKVIVVDGEWEIPLNICELLSEDMQSMNSISYASSLKHIHQLIAVPKVSEAWFASLFQNCHQILYKQTFADKQHEQIQTKSTLKAYSHCSLPITHHLFYMQSLHRLIKYLVEQNYLFNSQSKQLVKTWIDLCSQLIISIGNSHTQLQIAQYLAELSLQETVSLWWYLRSIRTQKQRVANILTLFQQKINLIQCELKLKCKKIEYAIFHHLYLSQFEQRQPSSTELTEIDALVLKDFDLCEEANDLKLKFIELSWNSQLNKDLSFKNKRHKKHFSSFEAIMKKINVQTYFCTRKVRLYVFLQYLDFMMNAQRIKDTLKVINSLCEMLFRYYSQQIHIMLFKIRSVIYNYYIDSAETMQKWLSVRTTVLKELDFSKKSIKLMGILIIYTELLIENHTQPQQIIPQKILLKYLIKSIKLHDAIKSRQNLWEIDTYYRCLYMLSFLRGKECVGFQKQRRLQFFSKSHKKIIELLLPDGSLFGDERKTQFYFFAKRYTLTISFQKYLSNTSQQESKPYLEKFIEKLNSFYQRQSKQNLFHLKLRYT